MSANRRRYVATSVFLVWIAGGMPASAQGISDLQRAEAADHVVWLDGLDLTAVEQSWGRPGAGKSVDGNGLSLGGKQFHHGLGTHANGQFWVDLHGAATKFVAWVGVDDEAGDRGSVGFEIWVDGEKRVQTDTLCGGQAGELISVNLTGARQMVLVVNDGGDGIEYDRADWAGAMFVLATGATERPTAAALPEVPVPPIVHRTRPEPSINGPRVVGATPQRPFLFLVPATGEAPLTFAATNLPAGLKFSASTGIISGALESPGETVVRLTVTNVHGQASRNLKIVGGKHKLAQTPPMGWNSWNCWAEAVSDRRVRDAADAMVSSGLAAYGFQYINIDDCWQGKRDSNGVIQCNDRFPDMKALADYVHGKGLKLGIYSSPGPQTCARYEGSYQHEEQDARTYAEWGVDYLKYDWCSYRNIAPHPNRQAMQKPYIVMRKALDRCDRDIVYSLCQYGMGNVWEWGEDVGANCWRTTGDISDNWGSMSGIGFGQDGHERYAGPGHWNDPDMLVVGRVGWGPNLHPTHLDPQEQLTHITLWSLLASPLLIGCDMTRMDDFTLALLTNPEVLDVNQDPLGKPAGRVAREGALEVWSRPLHDGTIAVGLVNRGMASASVCVNWSDVGLEGEQPVRDLWLRTDLGEFDLTFTTDVPPHGAVLLKIGNSAPGTAVEQSGPK